MIFTYVGDGNLPPAAINFMGIQEFDLNIPAEVEDTRLIEKLKGNKCFIQGKPDKARKAADPKAEAAEEQDDDDGVTYNDMLEVLKEADVTPASRKKADVVEAYESLA